MVSMKKGVFITFEGGEGCGKSTHMASLRDYFLSKERECVVTREPGGVPLAEEIRKILLRAEGGVPICARAELLLFEAARAQHVEEFIKPALAAGKVVLSDRFYDSTTAYQGAARNVDSRAVSFLNGFAAEGVRPDLTIVLDLPISEGMARAAERDGRSPDRMGSQNAQFYAAVRKAFLEMAELEPLRFAVVDSSGDRAQSFKKILRAVEERLRV